MIVIVAGGRDYPERASVFAALDTVHAATPIDCVLHGACGATWPRVQGPELTGADRWAHEWATERGVTIQLDERGWTVAAPGGVR